MAASKWIRSIVCCGMLAVIATLAGCQVDRVGMTLPSPYYLRDDVQYFAPGPDFKLANEAAALQQGTTAPAP